MKLSHTTVHTCTYTVHTQTTCGGYSLVLAHGPLVPHNHQSVDHLKDKVTGVSQYIDKGTGDEKLKLQI